MQILGIDIGGSGIKAAPVDVKKGILLAEPYRLETPQPAKPKPMLQEIKALVDHFHWKGQIGCGFPGVVINQVAKTAPNLHKSWIGLNVATEVQKVTKCPTAVLNDADAAGIAEYYFGAAKNHPGVVMLITVGTGLGTAILVHGQLYPNTELGHIFLKDGQEAEKMASGSTRKHEDLSFKEWAKRFDTYLTYLHALLYPDLFIIGGGIAKKADKFLKYLKVDVKVVPAKLENEAGIIGAAKAAAIYLRKK